jgi:alpha-L-fucosidase 2
MAAMMLVQTRPGKLYLLPALPSAWPTGKARGLRVRGNLTVDLQWKDGKVIHYRITSPTPTPTAMQVHVNGQWKTVMPEKM